MKFTITNFGQSRTIMVKGTGYYLTGRGGVLKTKNAEFAEVAATYPGIDIKSDKDLPKADGKKPIKVEKIIETDKTDKTDETEKVKVKKIKKTRSKK